MKTGAALVLAVAVCGCAKFGNSVASRAKHDVPDERSAAIARLLEKQGRTVQADRIYAELSHRNPQYAARLKDEAMLARSQKRTRERELRDARLAARSKSTKPSEVSYRRKLPGAVAPSAEWQAGSKGSLQIGRVADSERPAGHGLTSRGFSLATFEATGNDSSVEAAAPHGGSVTRRNEDRGSYQAPRPQAGRYWNPANPATERNAPTAKITSQLVDFDVTRDGQIGMVISLGLRVEQALGLNGAIVVYFSHASGDAVRDIDGQYASATGQVCVGRHFRPNSNQAVYDRLELFLPYEQLHLSNQHDLRFHAEVHILSGQSTAVICQSSTQSFVLNWPPSPRRQRSDVAAAPALPIVVPRR